MTEPSRRYESVTSICPFCSVGCSLAYDRDADRATGCAGAANPQGRLCPKGIAAFDALDDDGRLTTPLVRQDDELGPTSWTEAYDRIVSAFGRIRTRHGADALAFLGSPRCTNEENYLFQKIARLLGTNNVDNRARICHASTAAAMTDRLGSDAMTNSLEDVAEADAFLVVGANPADRQPIAFNSYVRPAVNAGATLIHSDPHANATTRAADYHLAPRPGYDPIVLSAMAAVIIDEGLADDRFIADRTTDFEAFERHLDDLDVDAAADAAGIDVDGLRSAARAFGEADRAAAIAGTGIEEDGHAGTDTADALLNLLLLTGSVGRRGTGMNLFRGLNNEQGAIDAGCQPFTLPGHVPVTDAEGRARIASVWGAEPPDASGRSELELVDAFGDDVRGAWVFGENPAVTKLDRERVARGLDRLECLVVQDVFPTETVARADVVLPASAWAEKGGTVTNLDRQVQRMRPATDPPGEARRDLAILCDLGRRLTDSPFGYDDSAAVFEELTRVAPPYAGMSYAGIESGGQRWPFPEGAEEGVRVLHRDRFLTGERRAPFRLVPYADAMETVDDSALVLVTGSTITEFGGEPVGGATRTEDTVQLHPADANERNIEDGDAVVVETDRGTARAIVELTADVRPGTVFMRTGSADPIVSGTHTPVRITRP